LWNSKLRGAGGIDLPEELPEEYVRALDLRPLEKGGLALVHWYYYPDSYDEWISSQDVDAVDPPDIYPQRENMSGAVQPRSDTLRSRPWRLCCRFVRDCELFNEWGNEIDYEIIDETTEGETDEESAVTEQVIISNKGAKSPNGRKSKKGDTTPKKTASVKKEVPILESLTYCTDRMMLDVPPPSMDRKRRKVAVVDIPAAIVGAATQVSMQSSLNMISLESTAKNNFSDVEAVVNGDDAGENSSFKKRKYGLDGAAASTSPPQLPGWFDPRSISSLEIRYLPGFFTASFGLHQRDSYLKLRTAIYNLYLQNPSIYLSATDCRRRVAGFFLSSPPE
jgi:SWI/SNF related-matrix-associated actin-dependent regulator of chromatin subfamily C